MLVGRAYHAVKLVRRQINAIALVPLKYFFVGFVLVQPQKAELGSQPDSAVVPVAQLDMAFPDFLDASAGEFDPS